MNEGVIEGRLDGAEATQSAAAASASATETLAAAAPASAEKSEDFAVVLRRVQEAAEAWGVHQEKSEGRFVSALLLAIGWSGRLSEAAQTEFKAAFAKNLQLFQTELACAREVTKAVNISLAQARTAQIALAVEKENLVIRMIKETLPTFANKLQGVLTLREEAIKERVRWRLRGLACGVSLGFFLAGYALHASMVPLSAEVLGNCLTHTLQSNGHLYCDVSELVVPR